MSRSFEQSSIPPDLFFAGVLRDSAFGDHMPSSSSQPTGQGATFQSPSDNSSNGEQISSTADANLEVKVDNKGNETPLPPLPDSDDSDTASLFDALSTFEDNLDNPFDEEDNLLAQIPSMYRLLNLLYETGAAGQGGLVEKIIIDQTSLGLLLNRMLPGSYQTVSRIDFKALDQLTVKPKGVYGSRPEIAKFLHGIGCIDEKTTCSLSMPIDDHEPTGPTLRSGLYLVLPPDQGVKDDRSFDVYIIYWPEETTWCDNATLSAQRNRVTFMRYLTQLTDQLIALVSAEQAMSFVWDSEIRKTENLGIEADDDDDDDSRMFTFEVSKSEEQEENVTGALGFKVEIPPKMIYKKRVELVGSEALAGLMLSSIEEPRRIAQTSTDVYNSFSLRDLLTNNQNVVLGSKLDHNQLRILIDNGLRDKYPTLFMRYDAALAEANSRHTRCLETAIQKIQAELDNERPEIEQQLRNIAKKQTRRFRVFIVGEQAIKQELCWFDKSKYPFIGRLAQKSESQKPMDHIRSDWFQGLKAKICIIRHVFGSKATTDAQRQAIIDKVLQERYEGLIGEETDKKTFSLVRTILDGILHVTGLKIEDSSKSKPWSASIHGDFEFVSGLGPLVHKYPVLSELQKQVLKSLGTYLTSREDGFVERNLANALTDTRAVRENKVKTTLDLAHATELDALWTRLRTDIYDAMKHTTSPQSQSIHIKSIRAEQHNGGRKASESYIVQAISVISTPKQACYSFFPLELTREDIQRYQNESEFIPRPLIQSVAQLRFKLEEGRSVEFMRPMQDRCLLVVASQNEVRIFMNGNSEIGRAVEAQGYKISLSCDHLGSRRVYAYDELTRSLALLYGKKDLKITWFGFDEKFSSLRNRSTLSLQSWYESSVEIQAMCFVTGSTELCLIDSSGCARVLSLNSEQFGPASLQIGCPARAAYSAPDGSCLFVTVEDPSKNEIQLRAFHWASFGEAEGFIPARINPKSSCLITSFESRGHIHLVSMAPSNPRRVSSTTLRVTQKLAEFDFKSKEGGFRTVNKQTINNCLIDCHMEVWSRFPVLPAVPRNTLMASVRQPQSITFISEQCFARAREYFTKMVATFERTTQKPTDGKLFAIAVNWSSSSPVAAIEQVPSSIFHFGAFIVELLCLIPIHLAVTKENCFIPLKDGVLNPAFQRKLLGADVPAIINSLSIGWYESLFQSYMATKPVRVVSSMGEQSVGKSYCLNHFADTSFAGSAMRTTEGVWLSCTPTDEYLLVSLDFEGVQSIERSAQEDTLLVLFNAAMSNMVLFRNNFAVSRNIASLFKSFQSSAMVLDPQMNPGLFNSDLAIIIKDVIGSDSKEIVREFSQKFKSIVREEKDQNFMSRLHRGHVHIIPWPVIKSRGFYTLFQRIRDTLEKQPITYGGGGVFLHTLKTLMAKIKANDWGALDKNLASHRAQQLLEWLPDAIGRGGIELGPGVWGQMKNIDTDQEVTQNNPVSGDIFWVPNAQGDLSTESVETTCEQTLATLIQNHSVRLRVRNMIRESDYIAELQALLYTQLDQRVEQVKRWISANVERFPQENQDIRNLVKLLETMALTARAALQLCASKCSSCHLFCLRPHRHADRDGHNCGTNHNCPFACDVSERHANPTPCGLLSGHEGRHLCEAGKHTCGQRCLLEDRVGCEFACVKEIEHGNDHMCSARIHFCGKPCDLRNVRQSVGGAPPYNCPGLCKIPWDQHHEQHACANSQRCPIECQLCPRLCSNPDHFHGLKADSVHLCGQAHSCTMQCEALGICQIETQPSAILEQFTGRYESFQYTRYAQEKRRLTCAVPIDPGQVTHKGPHTHSTADVVFHFCDVQCPRCKYYCTLPLGHPQHLHDTSHGSMTETQWLMEGPAVSASYELQEHKYGSGDQGSTVLCSMVCTQQGRHVHVDYCRSSEDCGGEEYRHIDERVLPHPDVPKDWISHKLYWARSGFRDPYSQTEKRNFAKCDAYCADPKHDTTSTTESPSYCKLPILHDPIAPNPNLRSGYVSHDGHLFDCQNPAEAHQRYHILFVIDSSSSMGGRDRRPLPNTPISGRLRSSCDNRYGAVLSALYGFWKSREPVADAPTSSARRGASHLPRADAYTIITFNSTAVTRVSNDLARTAEQLIDNLVPHGPSGGTSFGAAIQEAQTMIERNWSDERAPVIIFLSDGECYIGDAPIENLCRLSIRLGMPLAFYTISFGTERHSDSLRKMANVAREAYATAPNRGRDNPSNPCSYGNAIDSVQLANRFLHIADSLQKPRAALIGSSNNRLQVFM